MIMSDQFARILQLIMERTRQLLRSQVGNCMLLMVGVRYEQAQMIQLGRAVTCIYR